MTDEPLLRVSALSKFYGSRVGCDNVSFDLWPGEVLAVVGESGSGKTTLLNCLSTRLLPSSGTASYRMRDGQFREPPAAPELIGLCQRAGDIGRHCARSPRASSSGPRCFS